jgi:hypothetical protein
MHEDLISKIFVDREDNNLNAAEEQLRDGLSKFALVEVLYVCVFPLLFVFLFHVLLLPLIQHYILWKLQENVNGTISKI